MIATKAGRDLLSLIEQSRCRKNLYRPVFYRLNREQDKREFERLLADDPRAEVFDELEGQLQELVKSLNPTIDFKNNPGLLERKAKEHIGETDPHVYGVWVYYPWSSRIVHILDEEEFIAVRTNRNQYKITREEQNILATKKVGVMGLSVGQSVSVTMAMERGFGEIRLADFDLLELTNYNRIRTGLHNMGINKAVSTAREIAEMDPYLKVTCYTDGITEENMRDFMTKGGKLDLLVDECDGLHIKILSRVVARELNIPVIMEASDRSAIDVERFDLEPGRALLHGWLDHLDINKVREARTNEEKIPYLLAMLKMDTVSVKFKATMLEIEQTVTTWPQLAAEVTGGGGIMANLARRINLDQFHDSGRYYVDIDELITDRQPQEHDENFIPDPATVPPPPLKEDEMKKLAAKVDADASSRALLSRERVEKLITQASLAPSGGNNQPWKWLYRNGALFLFHDASRSVSFVDYDHVAANVSLGATLENLVIACQSEGLQVSAEWLGQDRFPLAAVCRIYEKDTKVKDAEPGTFASLAQYIGSRCTNRMPGKGERISPNDLETLRNAVQSVEGARLQVIEDRAAILELGSIITGSERLRFMHPQGHEEFFRNEARWTKEEYETMRDGIDLRALNLSPSEYAGMLLAKDEKVIKMLRRLHGGKGFEKMSRKAIDSAAAFGLVTMPEYSAKSYRLGGRAVERLWLTATKQKVALYPMTGPLFLFPRLLRGKGIGMTQEMKAELTEFRAQFEKIFDIPPGGGEIFLFRLCYADSPPVTSLRRQVGDILCFDA